MAKRKLSEKDRASLRRMLKRGLAKHTQQSVLLKSAAKKYGLSPITVRWYLVNLDGVSKTRTAMKKTAAGRKLPSKPARKTRRRKARASRSGQAGTSVLIKKAQAAARDRAREAATLKRLLPEYAQVKRNQEKLQGRLQEVRQLERAVTGSLRQAAKRAKKLETQLKGLI